MTPGFVAGNRNDFGDAQAICEEACRPTTRFARGQAHYLEEQIEYVEQEWMAARREDDKRRLLEIPGIGPITASARAVELGDAQQFANARKSSASIGLVPRQAARAARPPCSASVNAAIAAFGACSCSAREP